MSGRDVELVCGACEAIFARLHLRPLALGMVVRDITGDVMLMPRPGYSINEEARQRVARATREGTPDELAAARDVADYLRRHGGEIVYDLTCRCRRRYVRTSPDLYRQARATKGRWLTLSPGTATWPPPGP